MVAVEGREGDVQIQPKVSEQSAGDGGSSVLKLTIIVQAAVVNVALTVDKLDAPSMAQGQVIGEEKQISA